MVRLFYFGIVGWFLLSCFGTFLKFSFPCEFSVCCQFFSLFLTIFIFIFKIHLSQSGFLSLFLFVFVSARILLVIRFMAPSRLSEKKLFMLGCCIHCFILLGWWLIRYCACWLIWYFTQKGENRNKKSLIWVLLLIRCITIACSWFPHLWVIFPNLGINCDSFLWTLDSWGES